MDRRRLLLTTAAIVTAAFGAWYLASNAGGLRAAIDGLRAADRRMLLAGLGVSVLAMVNRGMLNHAAHRAVGLDAGVGAMTRTAAVGFSAQKVVKSAGAVGLAVFIRHGRRRGHAPGAVAAACMLTATASFAALGVLLAITIAALAVTGDLTSWWLVAAVGFALYSIAVVVLTVVVMRSRSAARRMWAIGQRWWRRMPIVRRRVGDPAPFPEELFDAVASARGRPAATRRLIAHAVASKLLGAVMLAFAAASVGLPLTLASALTIYATALAASVVSIVPGGVGAVEASTASLLIASGATVGVAALAVGLFRVLDMWLPMVTGAVMGRGELHPRGEEADERDLVGSHLRAVPVRVAG